MIVARLALKSLANRWLTAALTIAAIATSVLLLLGVERLRNGARESFADTISGTDLIVGARTGGIQLLLYSVFRIGNATNNITWKSYQDIASHPDVSWIVPLSLGDSHRGFRVLGTTEDYFAHFRYRRDRKLVFSAGKPFADMFDAVIGSDVATQLGYRLGGKIVIGHGLGSVSFVEHDDKPFRVSGILAKTGTPVDRTVHVSLKAIEAIHIDWQTGARIPGQSVSADDVRRMDLKPKAVTAALLGLKSRIAIFRVQRDINGYSQEPLTAILPGATLHELWSLVATAENALAAISVMVVITALIGMVTMILTTLNERRREMAILRAVGARPLTVLGLLTAEAGALTAAGCVVGVLLLYIGLAVARPFLDRWYGIDFPLTLLDGREVAALGLVLTGGIIAGLIPALHAYRLSLADGMIVRT